MANQSGIARALLVLPFGSLLALAALAGAADGAQAKNGAGLFVLPVETSWPVSDGTAQVFEERLGIALGQAKRVRALSLRDVPESRRRELPLDLSACVTPACLKRLGGMVAAERVLGLKLADDSGRLTLFSTVYDARDGAILQRNEWLARGGEPPLAPRLAEEVARWALGDPTAPTAPSAGAPPAPPVAIRGPASVAPGVVALDLAPGEPDSPQARALLDELAARLSARRGFLVIARGAARADVSHRAVVRIEQMHVNTRPHHLGHAREGTLAAALTITDLASDNVVFAARGQADAAGKVRGTNDAELMSALVSQVGDQWMSAFDAQSIDQKLRRRLDGRGSP